MGAERLTAGALPQVLAFDVVAFGAARVVVMMRLLDRVKRGRLSHWS